MAAAGKKIEDLSRIALVAGPGSFTGLRIGMAFVKGIHAALGTEIVTITSLELISRALAAGRRRICPMIDARKNEVYTALYEYGQNQAGPPGQADLTGQPGPLRVLAPPQAVAPEVFFDQYRQEHP